MQRSQTILVADDDDDAVLLLRMASARSRLANPLQVVNDGAKAIEYGPPTLIFFAAKNFPR